MFSRECIKLRKGKYNSGTQKNRDTGSQYKKKNTCEESIWCEGKLEGNNCGCYESNDEVVC